MANEIQYFGDPANESGLTLAARVYDDTGTQVGADVSLTEVGSLAIYRGDMPTASADNYIIRIFNSTALLSQGAFYWDGAAEIDIQTLDANLDTVDANVDAILVDTGTTIPVQISALNDFDPATETVTVGVINNNVITSSTIANNALNNSAFTTGYFNSINSEVDTALADYDPPTKAELDAGLAGLNDIAVSDILAAVIESGYTLQEVMRLYNSVLLSKVSGAGTGTEVFRDINDTKDRVTATIDASGNRTAITLDDT